MKHRLLLLAILLFLAAPATAAAAGAPAAARITDCSTGLEPGDRHLVAQGRMRAVEGATRLQMRFTLQVRLPDRPRWAKLPAPGFGTWNEATGTPQRYVYSKRVENLTAPARYRMIVRFRWLTAGGERVARARRVTRSCEQPDLRPDLEPRRVGAERLSDSERRYAVPVRNTGESPAGPFAVTLTVNGAALPSGAVTGLAPGRTTELLIDGPVCEPGTVIGVQVDSDGTVDEADEADNELLRTCPESGRL